MLRYQFCFSFKLLKLLLLLLLFIVILLDQCYAGGMPCKSINGVDGHCTQLSDCAILRIRSDIDYPWCDDTGDDELVCCPNFKKAETYYSDPENINKKKCEEWHRIGYANEKRCKPEGLISGGEKVSEKELPFMALLGRKNESKWYCGGTLLTQRHVLTALHCVETSQYDAEPTDIRLGELNYNDTNSNRESVQDFKIKTYSAYSLDGEQGDDIAIIELDRDAILSDAVLPACLPVTSGEEHDKLYAAGWGKLGAFSASSPHLLKVALEPMKNTTCGRLYKQGINLCYGSKTSVSDTCQGDSGGPLYTTNKEFSCMHLVFGVTSSGQLCGTPGIGGIYMKIFSYMTWIESIIYK